MNSLSTRSAKSLTVLVAVLGLFATAAQAQTSLTNGVPITGISGSAGSERFYKIEVPAGQDELEISISDGTGDVDLYVRRGSQPTTTSYDYRPYKIGNNETVTVANPAAGTWYIMLKGYNAYAGVKLLAEYSAATSVKPLTNGVPVTEISGAAGTEQYYSIEVPAGQTKLEISMSGGTGDADLYVKRGALPTTSSYDYRPYLFGNNETVTVNNPAAATWYIMIRGYSAYAGITLLATYGGGGVGTLLENGVPVTGLSGDQASEKVFRIEVPAGQTNLEIKISGGTGDADLYVKFGSRPTPTDYDYRPFLAGSNETVTVNSPVAGTWFIMIRGYSTYAGLTLRASYGGVFLLQDGVPVNNLAGSLGSETLYRIDVPSGMNVLLFSMSGGTGNADMYIKKGTPPTTSSWDYRPIQPGNTESVSIGGSVVPGTWYVMLRGTQAYSGVTLLADYSVSTTVTQLTNGVPVSDISSSQGVAKYFKIEVPSGQAKLEILMSGGTGDADLYVRRGSLPTTSEYDYRPFLPGNDESVTVNNPAAGTWFIMIRGYQGFSGVTLLATYGGGTIPDEVHELQNGVAVTGIEGSAGEEKFYKITVPSGQAKLEIVMSGGSGDADLYVRRGSKPTTTTWDYRPYLIGNNEAVTIDTPSAATYYIMIKGYTAFAGITLKATYTPVSEPVTTLQNGVAVTGLSGASGSENFFKIDVPAGQEFLKIEISGGTGDVDLYVRRGSKPTLTSWDYRPYLIGNNESVQVENPAAATWYIMLRGYLAYTGVTLKATYGATPPAAGNNFASDPHSVAVWNFEPQALTVDSRGTNTLTVQGSPVADQENARVDAASVNTSGGYFFIDDEALAPGFPLKYTNTQREFTVTFWMKIPSDITLSRTNGNIIFGKGGAVGKYSLNIGVRQPVGAENAHMIVNIGDDSGNGHAAIPVPDIAIRRERWYHVAVSYAELDSNSSVRIRIYDAGSETVAEKISGAPFINVSDGRVTIGAYLYNDHRYSGWIDELAVFNDILTVDEMDQIRRGTYGKL